MLFEEKPTDQQPEFPNSENTKDGGDLLKDSGQTDIQKEEGVTPDMIGAKTPSSNSPPIETGTEAPSDKKEDTQDKLLKVRITSEGDKVVDREQLPPDSEYAPQEYEDYSKLYEKTLLEIKEGEIVTGRIVAISEKDIAVDIGFKSEGTVPIEEFTDPEELKIGTEIHVYLDRVENQEGQLILSKKKAEFMKVWEKIREIHDTSQTVEGKIIRRIKGGMVVDLMGVDAFLPGSQIDVHPVRDFDALVSKIMDFRIVKINDIRKNVVLSHKILVEESLAEIRGKILGEMKIGNVLDGVVKNITDFGVFVDLGGVDGLLHITDLSWGRVTHPSEIVSLDQKIQVKVLDYDEDRQRISLGLKQLTPHPWEGVEERYPVGSKVTGKVVSIARYGAFVELEKGVEGLVHISEMSWTQNVKHPSMVVSVGDENEVIVLGVDIENRKISLGMKQCEPDPWENLEAKYQIGSIHTGMVRDLVPFGAFVELEEGIEGLVHISDLSWTRKVRHPGEIVKKGEEVSVQILGFDRNERRISLGYKQTQENPWDKLEQELTIRTQVKAKVVRILEKGVVVMLPQDVEGFVPNSHLRRFEKGADKRVINVDDELDLIVIEFDKEAKKIILSAYEAEKTVEEKEYLEYLKQQAEPTAEEAVSPTAVPTEEPPTEMPEMVAPELVEVVKEEAPEIVGVEEVLEPKEELPLISEPGEEKLPTLEPIEEPTPSEPVEKKSKKRKTAAEAPEIVEVEAVTEPKEELPPVSEPVEEKLPTPEPVEEPTPSEPVAKKPKKRKVAAKALAEKKPAKRVTKKAPAKKTKTKKEKPSAKVSKKPKAKKSTEKKSKAKKE